MVHYNNTSTCLVIFDWFTEVFHNGFATILSILAIASIVLTILVLNRVSTRTSTENILLAITIADLALPTAHLARYFTTFFGIAVDEMNYFGTWLDFLWNCCYIISVQLTLILAARRYMSLRHVHLYQTLFKPRNTRTVIIIVYVFSAMLIMPILFYDRPKINLKDSSANTSEQSFVQKISNRISSAVLKPDDVWKIGHWIFIFAFEILCLFVLAALSITFTLALSKKTIISADTPNSRATLRQENQKTKLILLVSLLVFVRGLVLGSLSAFYIFFSPTAKCSATIRRLTMESQISLTAMNFVVLYFTSQKFEYAFRRPRLFCSNHERRCSHEK